MTNPWTLKDGVYERQLGFVEQGFFWDSHFNGTADFTEHLLVEIIPGNELLCSHQNINQTWIALKHRFPLLGSFIEERTEIPYFMIDANQLSQSRLEEVTFHSSPSLKTALSFIHTFFDGPRLLSDHLVARLFVVRSEAPTELNKLYFVFMVAHFVTDGIGNVSLARAFLDMLADPAATRSREWPILDRLNLACHSEDLLPTKGKSESQLRWQRALGKVLFDIRWNVFKGGHTLPRHFTSQTAFTPTKSIQLLKNLSLNESKGVIACCRNMGLSFGLALPIIAQVALARILCRHFSEGKISEEEWQFRKRQPMSTAGPMNIRPYLDKDWYNAGGSSNVSLAVGFFFYHLLLMPLGEASNMQVGDNVPTYHQLLSKDRFLYRVKLIKEQSTSATKHPRFLDINAARAPLRVSRAKNVALAYRNSDKLPPMQAFSDEEAGQYGPVFSFGGSSMGNKDYHLPPLYPVQGEKGPTTLRLLTAVTHLHTRPAELYLGSFTIGGLMHFTIHLDGNVFDQNIADEWLSEVLEATRVYLVSKS